jgi:hypothetical protein
MEEFTALAMRRVYSPPTEQQGEFSTDTLDLLRKGRKRFRCCALRAE